MASVVFNTSPHWSKVCTYLDPVASFIDSFSWMGESTYWFKFEQLVIMSWFSNIRFG
jgi:hypothetical protein